MVSKYLDVDKAVDEYIEQLDWRIKENANLSYSFSSVFFKLAGEALANYTLRKIYPRAIAKAHVEGDFHIHNLYMGVTGYCAGWSIGDILREGFNKVPFKTESLPPKHLSTALLQIANFAGTLQGEWSGAQAFNALDIWLAPYIREDRLTYKEVKQQLQQFVYNLNISSRWGSQTPFTNITFDLKVPEDLKGAHVIYAGKYLETVYEDYQAEIDLLNKAFLEIMIEGDMRERIFTFPIPTYNLTKDFNWDSEISNLIFELASKFGAPYFQNFISSELKPTEVRAMCCRLRLDLRELYRRIGGYFGYSDKVGSVGVVTINLPRIGYLAKSESDFFERLEKIMTLAKESLEVKRKVVLENIEKGLLPFTRRYLGTLKWHFSTIGLVGGHEACLNFLGKGIETKEGKDFAIRILKFMREKLKEFQSETGNIYNLEATPAEGVSYRLARLDKKKYPKLKILGIKAPYYTNSTQLPVNYTDDIFEALKHQDDLQTLYTGGTVFHAFVGERITDSRACKLLVRRIAESFKLPYYTITPTFSICQKHGYIAGEQIKCPHCNKQCEVYSRVVGYYRPVQNWNDGKREEYRQRKKYFVKYLK
ncbi:MAG: ribonucleoside triphosphate reductase [Candidatus Thermoplasmatota archaeon]|nr:ribonucleoside triphosphate reductase [Candidatus Thermoplasmatota archaeon]